MADAIEIMITDANRQTSKQSSNDVKFIVPIGSRHHDNYIASCSSMQLITIT